MGCDGPGPPSPYQAGLRFVEQHEGSIWDVFAAPPVDTAMIYLPERYLAGASAAPFAHWPALEAAAEASRLRFRPILMTSAATTFGALPLLLGTGAGWESRQPIGIVIGFGVAISALLTLFIVPPLYALFAKNTSSPQRVSRLIDQMQRAAADDEI